MSSFDIDLGSAILKQLEQTQNKQKRNTPASTRKSKQTDRNNTDKLPTEKPSAGPSKKNKQKSKAKSYTLGPEKAEHKAKDEPKPVASPIKSHETTQSMTKVTPPKNQNEEPKETEDSDSEGPDDRQVLLEEIKKLGGTEEDLELISFSESEEEEIHEDSQVDPTLMHDLKDFMKGLDFEAVMGATDEQDQDGPQPHSTEMTKTVQAKSSGTRKKRKKASTSTESCSTSTTTHQKREKKKKKSNGSSKPSTD